MTNKLTKAITLTLPVNTPVYCTVHGCEGWRTLLAVRPRDGYIRIDGFSSWCPPFNFTLQGPERSEPHQVSEGGTPEDALYWERRNALQPRATR
jgi:hypothetical protein